MVTKQIGREVLREFGSVLAKIHMVTKHAPRHPYLTPRSVLAKIHMVTKPQKYGSTFLNVIEY